MFLVLFVFLPSDVVYIAKMQMLLLEFKYFLIIVQLQLIYFRKSMLFSAIDANILFMFSVLAK